jgi:hypothetical protein
MKKKELLATIKTINEWDYLYVLGLNYNVSQLRNYLKTIAP